MPIQIESQLEALKRYPTSPSILRSLVDAIGELEQVSPAVLEALDQSRDVLSALEQWDSVVALIDAELGRTDDAERKRRLLESKGRVLQDELLEEERAMGAFQQALALRPEDTQLSETIEHLTLVRDNWREIADRYLEEAQAATDKQLSTSMLLKAAEVIWRNQPDSPEIEQHLRQSLEIEPRNRKARGHLERLYRRDERRDDLAQLLDQRAALAVSHEDRLAALLALGAHWRASAEAAAEELADESTAKAIDYYRRALALEPSQPQALDFVEAALREREDWEPLARLYEDAVRANPPNESNVAQLLRLAQLYEDRLDCPDQAEECYRRLRKLAPANRAVVSFYRRRYAESGEPVKLLPVLEAAQRADLDPRRRRALAREMADIAENDAGRLEKAIDIWKAVLRMDQLAAEDQAGGVDATVAQEPIDALKRLYRLTTPPKWNALRELIREQIDALPPDRAAEKVALLLETIEIYRDHLKLDVMVINTYNLILALDPDHRESIEALAGHYEVLGRWADLIEVLGRQEQLAETPERKIELLRRIASLWLEKGNQSRAVGPLERILELDPHDSAALTQLEELYQKRRNWRALFELQLRKADHSTGEQREALLKQLAELATTRLGDLNEALELWKKVLAESPGEVEALEALSTIYSRLERWDDLALIIRQQQQTAKDPEESIRRLQELAELYQQRLADPERSVEVWREVLTERRDHPRALVMLRELLVRSQRWEDLETHLGQRGEYADLADALTTAADRCRDDQVKVRLYQRVAQVCADQLASPERAIKSFERVLAIDPDHGETLRALVPLYQSTERWSRLLASYEALVKRAEEPTEKLSLMQRIYALCEKQLGSRQLAFQWCAEAYELAPEHEGLEDELERLAAAAGSWEALLNAYRQRLDGLADEAEKARLLRRIAQVSQQQLQRSDQAEQAHLSLLELVPDDSAALQALSELYLADQRWSELAATCLRRSELASVSERDAADLLLQAAKVQEERLADLPAAIQTYERVAALSGPDRRGALEALGRLHAARADWSAFVATLERELELVTDGDARVDLLLRLAEVLGDELQQPERAVAALAEASEIAPAHQPTRRALERYLERDEGPGRLEAARLLRPTYEQGGDDERLARTLEVLLPETADSPELHREMLSQLAQLYEKPLARPELALEKAAALLAVEPTNAETVRRLLLLAERCDGHERAAAALEGALERAGEASWELALRLDLSRLYDDHLKRTEAAEQHLRRVLELDRDHDDAWRRLERLLREDGRWFELRELLYERLAGLSNAQEQRRILGQICSLSEDVLEDAPAAIDAYERALELAGDDAEATRALERLYRGAEQWDRLAALYQRNLAFSPAESERWDLLVKQARIRALELNQSEQALELIAQVTDAAPEHERAVALLETMLETTSDRSRILTLLERACEQTERWPRLVELLQLRVASEESSEARRDIYLKVAELQQTRLEDRLAAFNTLRQAIKSTPGDERLASRLDDSINELGLWQEGVESWQQALAKVEESDRELQIKIWLRIADLQLTRLERAEPAAESFEAALALGIESPEVARAVTGRLASLYRAAQRWADLVRVLRARLPWLEAGEQTRAIHAEVAQIEEELLDQPEQAVSSYRSLLAEDPQSELALAALERILLRAENWAELVEVLKARVELAPEPDDRRQLWRRIADLQENALEDVDQTLAAHLAVLEEFPQDRESLRTAARIYRQGERWPELLQALERQLELCEEGSAEQLDLLYQAAEVQHRRTDEVAAALERYGAVLAASSQHTQAREALEELLDHETHRLSAAEILAERYQADANWSALVRVSRIQAAEADGAKRVDLLRMVAQLLEQNTGDVLAAFAACREAMAAAVPLGLVAEQLTEVERLAQSSDSWAQVVESIEAALEQTSDEDDEQYLHQRAAAICQERLRRPEQAIAHYKRVLELEPDCMPALEALDRLYAETESWLPLLGVLLQRAELVEGAELVVPLLLRAAAVFRDRLDRSDDAIEQLERVLELAPSQPDAVAQLEQLYIASERWSQLCTLLAQRAEQAEHPAERVQALERIAAIKADKLADPAGAAAAWREVVKADPHHEAGRAALEGFLQTPELQQPVMQVLEPIYVAQQQWNDVVGLYELRLQAADTAEQRKALSQRIAQLCEEQLEDLERALQWYGRVFSDSPSDVRVREQLLRLGGILDRWDLVAELFEGYLAEDPSDSETVREVSLALGRIYADRLYRWQPAQRCYERVLQRRPDDLDAFDGLERLLIRYERWQELLGCYERAAERALGTAERRELLRKTARVWEDKLEDLAQAIDVYRSILAETEEDSEVVGALDRLYRQSGRWEDLCELLERQLGAAAGAAEQVSIKFQLGGVHEQQLGDLAAAIDYYEEVLRQQPGHPAAVEALERLVLDRGQRFRITQILEPVYKAADEWAKLVVVHEAELDFVDDAERRVHLMREVARLHEQRGGSTDLAFKALSRAFSEEQRRDVNEEILAEIERLAEGMGNWQDVAELLKTAVEGVYDHEFRNELLGRLARLQEERLSDVAGAIHSWRRLLTLREHDGRAISELLRLLEQEGRHEQLVEVLQRKAELTEDLATRRECYSRIGLLSEEALEDTAAAIDAWRQVLSLDEHDQEALDRLGALLEATEDWQELVWVYQQKVLLIEDDQARWRELQLAMVDVYEQKIGGTFEAIALLKSVLDRIPDDTQAYDALDRLYSHEGLWSDLLELVDLREAREEDQDRANELRYRAGMILLEKIGDSDAAVDRLEQVLAANPRHAAARAALEQVLEDPSRRERVGALLERVYEQVDDTAALVGVLETSLDTVPEPEARCAVLVRVASLKETRLAAPEAAFDAYRRALAEDPASETVQAHVERLSGPLDRWPETLELYEASLDELSESSARRSMHLKLAQLYEAPAGREQLDRAEEHFRAALDLEGDDVETLHSLEQLLARRGKQQELLDVLERLQVLAPEPAEQAQLSWRMGEIQHEMGQPEAAFAAYRDALERDASHRRAREAMLAYVDQEAFRPMALDVLEPLYESDGDSPGLVRLWELRLTTQSGSAERVGTLEQIARLQQDALSQPADALKTLARALEEEPENAELLSQLEQLAERTNAYPQLCRLVEGVLQGEGLALDARRDLGLQLARWHSDRCGDSEQAARQYRAILEQSPDCEPAWRALEQLHRAAGNTQGVAEALQRVAELVDDSSESARLWAEVAQLQDGELNQPEQAIAAWQQALEQQPDQPAALAALAALYQRLERWPQLVEVWTQWAGCADTVAEEVSLRYRAGELLLDRLGQVDQAAQAFAEVLDLAPDDEQTLAALVRLRRGQQDWSAVRELLTQQLEGASGDRTVELYRQLAEISADQLADDEAAVGYYQQILLVSPGDEAAYERLGRFLRDRGRWQDLLETKRQQATRQLEAGSTGSAVGELLAMARIWSDELSDPHAAAQLVEEALDHDANQIDAISELARLYQTTEQWDLCLDAVGRAEGLGPSGEQAAELKYRRARALQGRGAPDEEVQPQLEAALQLNGAHLGAAEGIEELARKQQRWDTVAQMLELRGQLMPVNDTFEILRDLALLYRDELSRPDASAATWQRALAIRPDDDDVAFQLAEAHAEAGRFDESEVLVRRLIDKAVGRRSKALAGYHHLLGVLAERRGDSDSALAAFEAAYQVDSTRGPTLVALGRLLFRLEKWESARKIYRSMLLQNPQADWGITRAEIFCQIGLVHKALGEVSKARTMFERGLESEPENQQLKTELAELEQ